MAFDVMGHLKLREVRHWDRYDTTGNDTYINNRRQGWQYDADGRLISGNARYVYDAAGQISSFDDFGESKTEQQLDGDGRRIRSEHKVYNLNTNQWSTDETKYYIHSSVLGQLITELNTTDGTDRSFVYAGGKILAIIHLNGGTPQFTTWEHYDPNGGSYRSTYSQGDEAGGAEMDPLGADAGMMKPIVWNPPTGPGKLAPYYGIPELSSASSGCILDGIQVPCSVITEGNSRQCENNQCRSFDSTLRNGQGQIVEYQAYSDGLERYLPEGWSWTGTVFLGPSVVVSFIDGVPRQAGRTASWQNPDRLPGSDQTACKVMADVADDSTHSFSSDPQQALLNFDYEFSRLYHGGPIRNIADAQRYAPGDLRQINPYYASNASGFKEEYRDTGTEPFPIGGRNAEQTHHFSAYLSMGINGRLDIYEAGQYGIRPSLTLPHPDNDGDQRLGHAAFAYGLHLRKHPEDLKNIRRWILRNICTSEGHGLYMTET